MAKHYPYLLAAALRLRRSPIFIAFARKASINSVGAASESRASTERHPWFDAAPTELMRSGRGFYKDVGPTGLRSRLPRKMWVMLRQQRRTTRTQAPYRSFRGAM